MKTLMKVNRFRLFFDICYIVVWSVVLVSLAVTPFLGLTFYSTTIGKLFLVLCFPFVFVIWFKCVYLSITKETRKDCKWWLYILAPLYILYYYLRIRKKGWV